MYRPALILEGSVTEVIWALITGTVGVFALSVGVEGWMKKKVEIWERGLMILGAVLLMYPWMITEGIGVAMIVIGLIRQFTGRADKEKTAGIPL